jgi:hypothetical protein
MDWRLGLRVVTALTFATATAYGIWRVEWFDVFRWGAPSPRLVVVYACYVGAAGSVGWFLATLVARRRISN